MLLGRVMRFEGGRIKLFYLDERLRIKIKVAEELKQSFPYLKSPIGADECIWGIFLCENGDDKCAWVLNAGFLRTALNGIPFDSKYEKRVLSYLADKRRIFEKPLRFDVKAMKVRPDFILKDVDENNDYPIEVWGIEGDAAYDKRKDEKRAIYINDLGHPPYYWWEWYASLVSDPDFNAIRGAIN
jgi:Protein of unknown function (DUF1173)